MVTFHPKWHSGKLWKVIYNVGLYLFGKKLNEIILNAHTPKKDQNNISPIAHKHQHPFQIGGVDKIISVWLHSSCHHSVVKRFLNILREHLSILIYSAFRMVTVALKGLAQAKIIKKSVILFRVLNMTIWCKHVHRLELQFFIIFVLRIHQLG